jgi:hypothetical protein
MAIPSECALLDWIGETINRPLLQEISLNDYGEDSAEHLSAIQTQLAPNPPLGLPPWYPCEVLELERWNQPERTYRGTRPEGARGHLKRLLACLILLRNGAYLSQPSAYSEEDFFLQTSAATVLRFALSAIALHLPAAALGFLLWLLDMQQHPRLRPFIAFCVLALSTEVRSGDQQTNDLLEICDWVDSEESQCRAALGKKLDGTRWLLGLNSYECARDRRAGWVELANQIAKNAGKTFSSSVQKRCAQFLDALTKRV